MSVSGLRESTPIENIISLSSTCVELGNVLPANVSSDELRGMALFQEYLFVAQAHKSASAILSFGPINGGHVAPAICKTVIDSKRANALWHPYGLILLNGQLFVSNQDSNVISAYNLTVDKDGTPTASIAPVSDYLSKTYPDGPFLEGTRVASATALTIGGISPFPVPHTVGLSYEELICRKGTWEAQEAFGRGILAHESYLYVADQPGHRVMIYEAASGKPIRQITSTTSAADEPNALSWPVALAHDRDANKIAISSPGNKAIFEYDPRKKTLTLLASAALYPDSGVALKQLSGLAYTPDGALLFGSRANRQVYQLVNGAIAPFGPSFGDAPEALLVVEIATTSTRTQERSAGQAQTRVGGNA